MTKNEIIKILSNDGYELKMDNGLVWGMLKDDVSVICSTLGANPTISISFNGKQNDKKAKKLIKELFPNATYIKQGELLHASYFSLPEEDNS